MKLAISSNISIFGTKLAPQRTDLNTSPDDDLKNQATVLNIS